jgi:hypothetical protein
VAGARAPLPDLSEPRTFGELMDRTFALFGRHVGVFLTLALVLVAPTTLLVDGIWGRALADGIDAKPPAGAEVVSAALRGLVILPLITAANVLTVRSLAGGHEPSVGEALRDAARVFPRVLGAVLLYGLLVTAGGLLLVIPGIWLGVRGYFAAQAAVIDGLGPLAAFRRSSELVQGHWWRTFGYVALTGILFAFGGALLIAVIGLAGSPALYVSGLMVVGSAAVSLTATFATLLFYDLRARRREPGERMAA